MSLFSVAGVSRNKGTIKVRFCSDMILRIKNLQKQGDTDIFLIELPKPMTKFDICNYLLDHPAFQNYTKDIQKIAGKKTNLQKSEKPLVINQPEVDPEIEELRELAEA